MSSPMTDRLRSKPIPIPVIADPISVTAMMPMITPRAVRIERILCARICPKAMRKLSPSSMVMSFMALRLRLLNRHLRSILQFPADGGVAAGDDFVAGFDAAPDLDVGRVGDAGLGSLHAHRAAGLDEHDALQLFALFARFLLLERLVRDVRFVVVVLGHALGGLFLALLGESLLSM